MAGNAFEERLTRLEEQLKALQALTQGLAAWEMGVTGTTDRDKHEKPFEGPPTAGASADDQPGSNARV